MKNTLKTILAALSLAVVLAACGPKPATEATETPAADTTTVVEADTTATTPADTTAAH